MVVRWSLGQVVFSFCGDFIPLLPFPPEFSFSQESILTDIISTVSRV